MLDLHMNLVSKYIVHRLNLHATNLIGYQKRKEIGVVVVVVWTSGGLVYR